MLYTLHLIHIHFTVDFSDSWHVPKTYSHTGYLLAWNSTEQIWLQKWRISPCKKVWYPNQWYLQTLRWRKWSVGYIHAWVAARSRWFPPPISRIFPIPLVLGLPQQPHKAYNAGHAHRRQRIFPPLCFLGVEKDQKFQNFRLIIIDVWTERK